MNINISFRIFSLKQTISISRQWIQFGIITAVILASIIVSYWGTARILMFIPVLLVGFVVFGVLIGQLNIGFILIILAGMFIPYSGPGGINATVLVVGTLLFLWIMEMIVVRKNIQFVRSQSMIPIMVFLVISTIAFFIGQISWFAFARQAPIDAQLGGFVIFSLSMGGMLLSANLIKEVRWLKIIVWTFLGLSTFYIIGRMAGFSFVVNLYNRGFIAQSMFWTWLVALAAGQIIFNNKLTRRLKVILISLVIFAFYVTVIQTFDWKSGWVPPLIALAALIGIRYPKLIVFASPIVAILVGYYVINVLVLSEEYSWGTRLDAWRIVLEISRVSPIFGMGFANYYWYTLLFSISGWYVNFNSHSQFVDLIAQTGYLGLISFTWLFFTVGRLAWKLAKQLPDGFSRAYSYGVFAGIIGTMVAAFLGDWILPFVYNVGLKGFQSSVLVWIFLGGVISIEQIFRNDTINE